MRLRCSKGRYFEGLSWVRLVSVDGSATEGYRCQDLTGERNVAFGKLVRDLISVDDGVVRGADRTAQPVRHQRRVHGLLDRRELAVGRADLGTGWTGDDATKELTVRVGRHAFDGVDSVLLAGRPQAV